MVHIIKKLKGGYFTKDSITKFGWHSFGQNFEIFYVKFYILKIYNYYSNNSKSQMYQICKIYVNKPHFCQFSSFLASPLMIFSFLNLPYSNSSSATKIVVAKITSNSLPFWNLYFKDSLITKFTTELVFNDCMLSLYEIECEWLKRDLPYRETYTNDNICYVLQYIV